MIFPTDPYIFLIAFYMLGVALLTHWRRPNPLRYQLRLLALILVGEIIFATGPFIEAFFVRSFYAGIPSALLFFRVDIWANFTFIVVGAAMYAFLPAVATAIFALERTEESGAVKISVLSAVISLLVSDTILFARKNIGTLDDYLLSIISNLIGGAIAGVLIGLCSIQIRRITSSERRVRTRPVSQRLSRSLFAAGCGVLIALVAYFVFGFTPPTPISLKLEHWSSISFEYAVVYKNDATRVEVVPIRVTGKQLSGFTSGPTEIEWSATQQSKTTSVELELFAASAELSAPSASFPKLTVDALPFYRGVLSPSKFRVTGDDMAWYWIRSDNEKLDFSTSVRTNVTVGVDNDWRPKISFGDGQQRLGKSNTVFSVGGKGALFSASAPAFIELVLLPGNSQTGFLSQTKEILGAVKDDQLIKFDAQAALPSISVRAKAVKSHEGPAKKVYPMILARLKSVGDITFTSRTPTSHFIFDTPSFDLDVFGVRTVVRNIIVRQPQGKMQLGSESYQLSKDILIDGSGLAFNEPESSKLALKGTANIVLVDTVQLIPTIAQSLGKEIWAGVIGGLVGSVGTLVAVWWPRKKRG